MANSRVCRLSRTRIDELRSKVDKVVSQLNVLTNQSSTPAASVATNPPSLSSGSAFRGSGSDPADISVLLDAANDDTHGPVPTSAPDNVPSIIARGLLSLNEAGHLIQKFRSSSVPIFPFVVLEPDDTAARLQEVQPFLFLCIVAATMPSAHCERPRVTEEIMRQVTSRVIVGSERNLDLLRGLIVHCAWYSYPAERNHPRLILFVQLCVTIVYDLGLHMKGNLTSHEQRALLGAYSLSIGYVRKRAITNDLIPKLDTMLRLVAQFPRASALGRPISMKYSQSIEDIIRTLGVSIEHASDASIRPFIQLQSFILEIDERYKAISSRKPAYSGVSLPNAISGSLLRQFQTLRQSIEHDLSRCPDSTSKSTSPTQVQILTVHRTHP